MTPHCATRAAGIALALLLGASPTAVRAQEPGPLQPMLDEQLRSDRAAVASQERVTELSDETREMLLQYRQYLAETRSLQRYADQLESQVEAQESEIELVKRQLTEIESTARDVLPLMQDMLDTLENFVALDLPFQLEERHKRIASLRDAMGRADVTVSEKYRRILEAYQIETDYGRTLEAWQGEIPGDDAASPRTVRFLRLGRVALLYQTLDGSETGYWDAGRRQWVVDDSYRSAVRHGFAVADKSLAPDLVTAPVPAPVAAQVEGRS